MAWQSKLAPVQQDMEGALATRRRAYEARKVTFHLPDFIDIVINAGDDRSPLGATIGESLPNWGPVANEGRGRTVAMVNLYTDPDSAACAGRRRSSLSTGEPRRLYSDDAEPGLLATILHEATHNLGPAHEYKVARARPTAQVFGGPLASMLEELKAQTGALFFVEFLRKKGLVTDDATASSVCRRSSGRSATSRGHVQRNHEAEAVRTARGDPDRLPDRRARALTWDANALAANGTDKGAFMIALRQARRRRDEKLMKVVGHLKASGDQAGAKALAKNTSTATTFRTR